MNSTTRRSCCNEVSHSQVPDEMLAFAAKNVGWRRHGQRVGTYPSSLADRATLHRPTGARCQTPGAAAVIRVFAAAYRRHGAATLDLYRAVGAAWPALRF